jgi:hypothetical protein
MFKVKPNTNIRKGIAFAGCSFTWGQGLYYYSNLPTLDEPAPDAYNESLLTQAQFNFKDSVRGARLVANHFNTFEIVQKNNGGSNDSIMGYFYELFQGEKPMADRNCYGYNEVKYLVYQLTYWTRDKKQVIEDGHNFTFSWQDLLNDGSVESINFFKYIRDKNYTFDELSARYIQHSLMKVKKFLMHFESKGIKTIIYSWPVDFVQYIKQDEWLNKRFMEINYNNQKYDCMETMMKENRNLVINGDTVFFEDPPKDHHPSLECHQVMAKNIIEKLDQYERQ